MGSALKIRDDLTPLELRRWARVESYGRAAARAAVIIAGPEPERDGVCAWTRADLCRWLEERFAKTYHPSSMTRVLRRMGFSRQKARPSHPRRDAEAQERFKKGGFATS